MTKLHLQTLITICLNSEKIRKKNTGAVKKYATHNYISFETEM